MKTLSVILSFVLFTTMTGLADVPLNPDGGSILETNIQQEFDRRSVAINLSSMDSPRQRLDVMQQLLDEAGENFRNRQFVRLSSQPTKNAFDKLMTEAFVERFLKSNEVGSVESLFKMNCPEYVCSIPLEFVLAKSKVPDAILLLARAYSGDKTNAASQAVVNCLTRAFPTLKHSEQSDASFVVACEKWWTENRQFCTINIRYPFLPNGDTRDHVKPLKGLFVLKSK